MDLHTIEPDKYTLRYGELGSKGNLGYDDHKVFVRGCPLKNSISAHPPSSLVYNLQKSVNSFEAMVALNDSSGDDVCATFRVYADDILVAVAPSIFKSDGLVEISAQFSLANKIELVVDTPRCEFCHAVWIDARVNTLTNSSLWIESPIGGISVGVPRARIHVKKCLCFAVTENCIYSLKDMLGSLFANSEDADIQIVCFGINLDQSTIKYFDSIGVMHIPCFIDPGSISPMFVKTIMYSIAQVIIAESYVLMDVDMMCLGSLKAIWSGVTLSNALLVVPDAGAPRNQSVWSNLIAGQYPYFCSESDLPQRWHCLNTETCMTILNGGVIAGSREALLGLDTALRRLQPEGYAWCNTKQDVLWREQALLNIAAAKVGVVELDPIYNTQLLHEKPQINSRLESVGAWLHGKAVHILHFNGDWGKIQYEKDLKGKFALLPGVNFTAFDQTDRRQLFEGHAWMRNSTDHWRRTSDRPWRRQFEVSVQQLTYFYDRSQEISPSKIIDCGSSVGMLGFALQCGKPEGKTHFVDVCEDDILALKKSVFSTNESEWTCDEGDLLILAKAIDFSLYDVIVIDTSRDDRTIGTLLSIISTTLTPKTSIIIADVKNPLCKAIELIARAKEFGLIVSSRDESVGVIELMLRPK